MAVVLLVVRVVILVNVKEKIFCIGFDAIFLTFKTFLFSDISCTPMLEYQSLSLALVTR